MSKILIDTISAIIVGLIGLGFGQWINSRKAQKRVQAPNDIRAEIRQEKKRFGLRVLILLAVSAIVGWSGYSLVRLIASPLPLTRYDAAIIALKVCTGFIYGGLVVFMALNLTSDWRDVRRKEVEIEKNEAVARALHSTNEDIRAATKLLQDAMGELKQRSPEE